MVIFSNICFHNFVRLLSIMFSLSLNALVIASALHYYLFLSLGSHSLFCKIKQKYILNIDNFAQLRLPDARHEKKQKLFFCSKKHS